MLAITPSNFSWHSLKQFQSPCLLSPFENCQQKYICEHWLLVAALHTSPQNIHLLSPCENHKLKHMSFGIGYWWSPFTLATIRQSEAWGEGRVGAFGLHPLTSLAPTRPTSPSLYQHIYLKEIQPQLTSLTPTSPQPLLYHHMAQSNKALTRPTMVQYCNITNPN